LGREGAQEQVDRDTSVSRTPTPFSMCDHSKCSAQKVLSSHSHFVAVRPSERSEFPKESEKVEFLPFEVSDSEISVDLHLYLAFELFLSACCAAP
jgi:hypothetical protein